MPLPQRPAFEYRALTFDADTMTARMAYGFAGDVTDFIETVTFPQPAAPPDRDRLAALQNALQLVFLLSGVSYYKTRAPLRLVCPAFPLDAERAAFVETVYREGLGEFAYRNRLDLSGLSVSADPDAAAPPAPTLGATHRALVPVGGGKDSTVAFECLRRGGEDVTLFAVAPPGGLPPTIAATMDISGLPRLIATRSLSPELAALNKAGALNGHVPVTAIVSAIAVCTALLHGLDAVIMANESSASAPNLIHAGRAINHQYSKSLDFERLFAGIVAARVTPSLLYVSLLRPLTEAAIARRFAALPAYHEAFRSCNAVFRLDDTRRAKGWCCACPKCRFVFLALAPFMPRERLATLFGKDLLNDADDIDGFAELCGLTGHKPFECVGETGESAALMAHLAAHAAWKDTTVVQALGEKSLRFAGQSGADFDGLFRDRPDHRVPERYLHLLHAKNNESC